MQRDRAPLRNGAALSPEDRGEAAGTKAGPERLGPAPLPVLRQTWRAGPRPVHRPSHVSVTFAASQTTSKGQGSGGERERETGKAVWPGEGGL